MYGDLQLHTAIETVVDQRPESPALWWDGTTISYGEIDGAANEVCRRLIAAGVAAGDYVAVLARRGPAWAAALMGVLKTGAVCVPLSGQDVAERTFAVLTGLPLAAMIFADTEPGQRSDGIPAVVVSSDDLPRHGTRTSRLTSGSAAAFVFSTSGSTGQPQSVLHSHRSATVGLLPGNVRNPLLPADRVLVAAPADSLRMLGELFKPLLAGACAVLAHDFSSRDIASLIDILCRARVSVFTTTPSVLRLLIAEPSFRALTSLRHVFASAEPLMPELAAQFTQACAARLHTSYGLSECAPVASWDGDPPLGTEHAPLGRTAPLARVHVLNDDLSEAEPGHVGHLWVGGPSLALGYLADPARTAARFRPDPFSADPSARLFRTGDLAYQDDHGVLHFAGRSDEQLNVNGFRVEPTEVERVLARHAAVAEAAVDLRPVRGADGQNASKPVLTAYLVLDTRWRGAPPAAGQIQAFLSGVVPSHMWPRMIRWLDELPRLPGGKLDRRALREPGGGDPVPTARPEEPEEDAGRPTAAEEYVIAVATRHLPGDHLAITPSDHFYALGGRSLDLMGLIADLNTRAHVRMDVSSVIPDPTISRIAEAFSQALTAESS